MADHTEATLTQAIRATWPFAGQRPRYVVAQQVHDGAGFSFGRRLDAILFDTWPSEGLTLHGLEIKVSKADFRHELQNPKKAHAFIPMLDFFSIVAPPGIVDLAVLPPKWGLYCPTEDGKLRARRKPLLLHDEGAREDVDRSLMAAFCRALVTRTLDQDALRAEWDLGYKAGKKHGDEDLNRERTKYEQLERLLKDFEETSGIQIGTYRWNQAKIGEAVKFVMEGGMVPMLTRSGTVRGLAQKLMAMADELDALAADMNVEGAADVA